MKYLIIYSYLQKPSLQLVQHYVIVNSLEAVNFIINGYNNEETEDTIPVEVLAFEVDKPVINYSKESSKTMSNFDNSWCENEL